MAKIDLSHPEALVREIRLGSIIGYTGSASDLAQKSCGALADESFAFSQCTGCVSKYAFCQLALIPDAVVIAFPFDISPQTSPKRRWSVRRFGSQMASQTWKCYINHAPIGCIGDGIGLNFLYREGAARAAIAHGALFFNQFKRA